MKTKEQWYAQLRRLPQYKTMPEIELMAIAEKKERESDPDLDVAGMFIEAADKKLAKTLLSRYLEDFTIDNIAEKNTLKQLIFLEVLQVNSLQKQMNEVRKKSQIVPQQILDAIHKNTKEIKDLKNQLGIKKAEEDKSDAYKALESLKRKAEKWRQENQGSRTLCCPHCGKMVLLKIRMDSWEAQKHPMFKDRVLYNKHAFNLLKNGRISKMDVAKILDEDASSDDYVKWLLEKIQPKVEREK